jgi:hypothetical protein
MTLQVRQAGSPSWRQASRVSFLNEPELQSMLHRCAELIPLRTGDDAPRVFVRETGLPGSGITDLLGVDSDGNIYVVECKLASNPEIRRKVLGQILEYAASLWNMTFEDFDQFFVRREKEPLLSLMEKKAGADWVAEDFRAEVAKNLKSGTFHLIIAVDKMDDELSQIIRYLAACAPSIRLEAVEINVYKSGDTEIVVPEIHGREVPREVSSSSPKQQTLDQVLGSCATEHERSMLTVLVDEWTSLGHSAEPRTKGISFGAKIGETVRPVFWAPQPKFACVDVYHEGLSEDERKPYKEKIAAITGFDATKVMEANKVPRAYFKDMDEHGVRRLARVNNELVNAWRTRKNAENARQPETI